MATTPVLLPGKSHGQRSLVDYSPWGHKELDRTEQLHSFHVKQKQTHRLREHTIILVEVPEEKKNFNGKERISKMAMVRNVWKCFLKMNLQTEVCRLLSRIEMIIILCCVLCSVVSDSL